MVQSDPSGIIVAIISLISSAIVAVITFVFNSKHSRELENLKHKLAIQKDEKTALRDYEYDARKRLYQEFEPLLFELVEQSDSALFRIKKLASGAKEGKLKQNEGWLSGPGYFMYSTIYRLLSPLALFRIMQGKLTIFDLDLVPSYKAQYLLTKSLYFTFSDDKDLSHGLDYKPEPTSSIEEQNWDNMVNAHPEVHNKQGIFTGLVDKLVDALIISESGNKKSTARLKTISEFEKEFVKRRENGRSFITEPFTIFMSLLENFHPNSMPVFWRILLAQAHIYQAIKRTRDIPKTATNLRTLRIMSKEERRQFEWGDSTDSESMKKSFLVVQEYLISRENLRGLLET